MLQTISRIASLDFQLSFWLQISARFHWKKWFVSRSQMIQIKFWRWW